MAHALPVCVFRASQVLSLLRVVFSFQPDLDAQGRVPDTQFVAALEGKTREEASAIPTAPNRGSMLC